MNFTTTRLLCTLALAGCVCAAAAGCSNEDKETKPRRRDRISRRDPSADRGPDPVISRDRRRDTTSDRGAADRPGLQEIPPEALSVESSGPAGLEYEPSRDGVLYVYDVDADRVIFVSRVRDRERFRLDPEGGRATINSKTVYRGDLNPRHRYRLYFDRA